MFKRGLAFCLALVLVTSAQAQVAVSFVPNGGTFPAGSMQDVQVFLTQNTGSTKQVRFIQLDLNNSSAALLAGATYPTNPAGSTHPFWDFSDNASCTTTPATCGQNHFVEQIPATPRVNIGSVAFRGLLADEALQVTLPNNTAVRIGTIKLTMPAAAGPYTLDVINAAGVGPDAGAEVRWGFGVQAGDELAKFRSGSMLTGGTAVFTVSGNGPVNFVSVDRLPAATPAGNMNTLSQIRRNKIVLTFSGALPAAPAAGQVTMRELLAGGAFGADVLAGAGFTVSIAGNTLILQDVPGGVNPGTLLNKKIYGIHSTTWPGVNPFCVDLRVNWGDANNNGLINFADLATVNTFIGQGVNDTNRWSNIDGNAFVNFADMGNANTFIATGGVPVNRPAPHPAVCVP